MQRYTEYLQMVIPQIKEVRHRVQMPQPGTGIPGNTGASLGSRSNGL
jgi:hypothetical protein